VTRPTTLHLTFLFPTQQWTRRKARQTRRVQFKEKTLMQLLWKRLQSKHRTNHHRQRYSSPHSFSQTFIVNVGKDENKRANILHDAVFIPRSKFFQAALRGRWKEAEEKVINLPEDDPKLFASYVQAVYIGGVPEHVEISDETFDKKSERRSQHYYSLLNLYVSADKLQDTKTKNYAISKIYKFHSEKQFTPGCRKIKLVYRNTAEDSPLRRLVSELYAFYVKRSFLAKSDFSAFPPEFLADLIHLLAVSAPARNDLLIGPEKYYEKD
jgi:hypothetical protein